MIMQDIKGTCRQSSDQSDEPSRCMGRVAVRRFDLQTEKLDFKVKLDSNFVGDHFNNIDIVFAS